MDRNNDGVINDGKELFGSGTRLADGTRAADGFAAMAAEDSNRDGKLDAQDANWSKLQVWVDGDHDGVTDAGELKSLAELGITSFDLSAAKGSDVNNGNFVGLVSKFTKDDGSTHTLADVWFAKDTTPPPADEVIAAAPTALTLPGTTATPMGSTDGAVSDLASLRHGGLTPNLVYKGDDDERFNPPII